ncbi:MAG TPA: hypothetical protein VGG46_06055 [Terriglobales bacterium]|jgi:hypothetical protein
MDDPTKDLLTKVVSAIESKAFLESVFVNDVFDDWHLAKKFAEFLVKIQPDEIFGHALAMRAYRHLDDKVSAREELKECQNLIFQVKAESSEANLFKSVIISETQKLRDMGD